MGDRCVALVLAGGRVDDLAVLTAARPKCAVPVWGEYRFIDFALTNLLHSAIGVVGVLTQYRPLSLAGHLESGAPWDYVGHTRTLRILSPYQGSGDADWYRGTADAVHQNLAFLSRYEPEVVLIVSGDHVYSMDYRPMIRQHIDRGADLTIALKRVPRDQAHRFGTAVLDGEGRVVRYEEKAEAPASDLASLTVYAFRYAALAERVRQNVLEGRTYQLYSEVIPRMVDEGARVDGYLFDGYWQYARTLDDYYATSMDILSPSAPDLSAWRMRTNLHQGRVADHPPAFFSRSGRVLRSRIGAGARIEGTVEDSVISPDVVVAAGAHVSGSVVLHGSRIGAGARLDRVILDKGVDVGREAEIGLGEDVPNLAYPFSLSCGAVVVGKGTRVPERSRVGRGCIVGPGLDEGAWPTRDLVPGSSVSP